MNWQSNFLTILYVDVLGNVKGICSMNCNVNLDPLCMNLHVFIFMNLVMYAYLWIWTCELRLLLYGFVELMWGVQGVYIFFCFLSMLIMWSDLWSLCIKFINYYCHSSIIKMLCLIHKYICDICVFLFWYYVHLFVFYLALQVAST